MAEFAPFSKLIKAQHDLLSQHELYTVALTGDDLWAAYLAAFPEGTNPIYRERTEHDCSCCRQFIKTLGRVAAIIDGKLVSVWRIKNAEYPYDVVAGKLAELIESLPVEDLFRTREGGYGAEHNFELIDGVSKKWNHLHGTVAKRHLAPLPDKARGDYRITVQVFQRGLNELSASALQTVLDLIDSKALYRGEEFESAIRSFTVMQRKYQTLTTEAERNLFLWEWAGHPASRFRNTAIGTLIQDLSEGVELERAVRSYESKVAPTNYKRPTALITPRMVEDAMATIGELGLEPALERRFAKLSDVSVNNVLWVDNSVKGKMRDGIAGLLMEAAVQPVKVDETKAENIGIDEFMANVLPLAKTISLLVKNAHRKNLVSITAPVNDNVERLFKWSNNFAWSYDGNIADSIKEKVKRAGGDIDAPLRVSLGWFNPDDLDLHCDCPDGTVNFSNKMGILDVDMNAWGPKSDTDPVENLSWKRPRNGQYRVVVHQYNRRSTDRVGFMLELVCGDTTKQFFYDREVHGHVEALTFTYRDGEVTNIQIDPRMVDTARSQEQWGITTEVFTKVNTLMFSPNHWDGQTIGNKHWFFLLDGCKNPEPTRGIYNEFLDSRLEQHRKVFEVLGSKTKCPVADEQLSGVGFSSTRGDKVLVQVTGDKLHKTYLINF